MFSPDAHRGPPGAAAPEGPNEAAELSTAAPNLAPAEVQALVARLYGIDGSSIHPLAGERDQNCAVETAEGTRYVFKISNPSEPVPLVDFQIAALEHVARTSPSQPVPRVVRTLDGRTRDTVVLADGARTSVRMLTYLEGIQIRETPRTAAQRVAMGRTLAELNLALQGFTHPAATHDLLWNVSAAHRLTVQLNSLPQGPRRTLAQAFMARFAEHVLPRLGSLRAQVIHNDYHLYNVLVAPHDQARITGIIDFGDMLHAPLVGEVATAAAFHMTGNADPFEGPSQFVGAYQTVLPLTEPEQEIVGDLMATRHLITALISEWRALRYPENRAYIMRHNPAAWEALSQLADLPRHEVRDRLLTPSLKGFAS
ncbi:aminoglycoside phosphotransferase [Hydrogenophaga taeniospiralis CCUG 15921]|uniref:Hydroxylysine kinase n=1 Tax=Hydrogenophaga taeniospiralis CCUG 15921 TaxID=1281780 RepID=A0A9X4S9F4_9BURK|nr:phosphotransferase [Hydrogenophaga taeniospiralis]MDG5975034.1 aminoglycoside phosphotransferase [Hydrogenophaga taeniospiralis CCUG 15921]